MNKQLLLGIDVGTLGSKGVLLSTEGKVVAESFREHDVYQPYPGWAEHDPEAVWWKDFVQLVREIFKRYRAKPPDVLGICVSALMPDVVLVNRQGHPLYNAILYSDNRAYEELQWGKKVVGDEMHLNVCGTSITTEAAWPKLLWVKKHKSKVWSKAYKFLSATNYLVLKLTSQYSMDFDNATAYLFDLKKGEWSEELCQLAGIPIEKLPSVFPSHQIVGEVEREASKETGLAKGTPVLVGCGDVSASTLSSGVTEDKEAVFYYGSTGCLLVCSDQLKTHPKLWAGRYLIPGKYLLASFMATSGIILRWFRDEFGQLEVEKARRSGSSAYSILDQEASRVAPGSDGLIVLPYFQGEKAPIWNPLARGVVFGLLLNHTRAHLYRSLLEAVGYGLRHNLDMFEESGMLPEKLMTVDGGAKSRLWRQIVTDITGIPQHYIAKLPGAPFGDAYLAGYGVGLFKDFRKLKEWLKVTEVTHSRQKIHQYYTKLYSIYRKLYESVGPLFLEVKALEAE